MPYPDIAPPTITPAAFVEVTVTTQGPVYVQSAGASTPIMTSITGADDSTLEYYVDGVLGGGGDDGFTFSGSPGSVLFYSVGTVAAPFPRTITLRAQSVEDPTAYDEITIIVYDTVTVAVSPDDNPLANPSVQFSAVVTGIVDQTVTWATTGGSIDSSGLFTGPPTNASYTITATAVTGTTDTATTHTVQGA